MRIAVVGATGRFGSLAVSLIETANDLELHCGLGSADSLEAIAGADLVFDATRLEVSQQVVAKARELGIPIVVATSGWSAERIAALDVSGSAVLIVPNFSLGSVLGSKLAALAAPFFDQVEIVETHHASKIDAPSGTATRTAEVIATARAAAGITEPKRQPHPARGQEVAGIPVHSLRLSGVDAEQRVELGRSGESLRITHTASSSEAYEKGILLALRQASSLDGVNVGLDVLLDLGLGK